MASLPNRRADTPRRQASATAAMIWEGHSQVCLLENRSPKGARLRVNADLSQPKRFTLEMTPGELVPVRAVWRTRDHVGVRLDEPGAGRLDALRQLWRFVQRPVLKPQEVDAG